MYTETSEIKPESRSRLSQVGACQVKLEHAERSRWKPKRAGRSKQRQVVAQQDCWEQAKMSNQDQAEASGNRPRRAGRSRPREAGARRGSWMQTETSEIKLR